MFEKNRYRILTTQKKQKFEIKQGEEGGREGRDASRNLLLQNSPLL
jgi:hypothetical protein